MSTADVVELDARKQDQRIQKVEGIFILWVVGAPLGSGFFSSRDGVRD